MSANRWSKCPRCAARAEQAFAQRETQLAAAYGTVPVEEFDAMRAQLAADRAAAEDANPTFREDWEIHGTADGVAHVEYGGGCSVCGLSLEFRHDHELPV